MRNYIVASWNDADQYNYSGEQIGNRGRKSGRVHFNPDGSACVASYGDDEPKATKVSIKDRILPQARRLNTLRSQMLELENSYRAGEMSISEYSLYRDVIVAKIERQEVLYKRAASVRPKRDEIDEDSYQDSAHSYTETFDNPSDNTRTGGDDKASWIDDLPATNSFRKPLKNICTVTRTLVRWWQQAAAYYRTLKEV